MGCLAILRIAFGEVLASLVAAMRLFQWDPRTVLELKMSRKTAPVAIALSLTLLLVSVPVHAQEINGAGPLPSAPAPLPAMPLTGMGKRMSASGNGFVSIALGACTGSDFNGNGNACWSFTSSTFRGSTIGTGELSGAVNNTVGTNLDTGTSGGLEPGGGSATFTAQNGDTISFELRGLNGWGSQEGWVLIYAITGGTGRFSSVYGGGTLAFATPAVAGTFPITLTMTGSIDGCAGCWEF